jgi:hypothetical protein
MPSSSEYHFLYNARREGPRQSRENDHLARSLTAKGRNLPFVACDGEGAGGAWVEDLKQRSLFELLSDDDPWRKWRQDYKLFRIGEQYILNPEGPLSSIDCLEFIAKQPADCIMVGYYFNYDATMILRDVHADDFRSILNSGFAGYHIWNNYAISYLPGQKIGVGRINSSGFLSRGTMRYIYDVGRFFQCKFVKAIKDWKVATPEVLAAITEGKDARGSDVGRPDATISDVDIEYNRLECIALEELMTRFRQSCIEADCVPLAWTGPGQIAARLLGRHKILKRKGLIVDKEFHAAWSAAFYGGRFEASKIGRIYETVYEYDIRSAYPRAMLDLPCLQHAELIETDDLSLEHWVGWITFDHPTNAKFCCFPIRQKDGGLCFPRRGKGYYTSHEIRAAIDAGAEIKYPATVFAVRTQCDCRVFDWVDELYRYRRSIGASAKGVPIKLGLNSMYGKLVQRIGAAPYFNPIWSTLVTALVRTKLFRATMINPAKTLMLATDALYTTAPLDVDLSIGDDLGQWEAKVFESIFIAKPGIYVAGTDAGSDQDVKSKTRGISLTTFQQQFPAIEEAWRKACLNHFDHSWSAPKLQFPVRIFNGCRLALHRDWEIRGTWTAQQYTLNMDWANKRERKARLNGYHIDTRPKIGDFDTTSYLYGQTTRDIMQDRIRVEAMPDYFAFEPVEVKE